MNFVEFNLNFNRQHINNILRYLITLFLLISTQLTFSQEEENKNEIIEFDKEILKTIEIIPISEAKSILEHSLTKPISPLNLTESEILEAQKNRFSQTNLKENLRH